MRDVASAYNSNPLGEWLRLERDAYHQLEFAVTMRTLKEHLEPGSLVLDAGGGPGRYAIELCRTGHQVVLYDVASELVGVAREKMALEPPEVQARLLDTLVGDVRDMSALATGRFDAVLCLGPLTHLPDTQDRRRALAEVVRVCQPGGLIALSVGGYLAVVRTIVERFSDELLDDQLWGWLAQGDVSVGGMRWHFWRADELRLLAEEAGLSRLTMVGCQGILTGLIGAANEGAEDPLKWSRMQELAQRLSEDPALVDLSEHILYIGRKPA